MIDINELIGNLLDAKEKDSCVYQFEPEELNAVMNLLNKRMRKSPIKITYKPLLDEGWEYECPSCGYAVGENLYQPYYFQKERYCPDCGQRLDWSD